MTKKRRVAADDKPGVAETLWAYGYEMVAPPADDRMAAVRSLLDRQNDAAVRNGRTWSARLVATRVVHVLIVSASPELDVDINSTLEAELAELGVQYLRTIPMRVSAAPEGDD